MRNQFGYIDSSPEVIRLAVTMYIRCPLSLRGFEDLLFERGIDIHHQTVRYRCNRFAPMFAAAIRKRRIHQRWFSQWRRHLDEVFVRTATSTAAISSSGTALPRSLNGVTSPRESLDRF